MDIRSWLKTASSASKPTKQNNKSELIDLTDSKNSSSPPKSTSTSKSSSNVDHVKIPDSPEEQQASPSKNTRSKTSPRKSSSSDLQPIPLPSQPSSQFTNRPSSSSTLDIFSNPFIDENGFVDSIDSVSKQSSHTRPSSSSSTHKSPSNVTKSVSPSSGPSKKRKREEKDAEDEVLFVSPPSKKQKTEDSSKTDPKESKSTSSSADKDVSPSKPKSKKSTTKSTSMGPEMAQQLSTRQKLAEFGIRTLEETDIHTMTASFATFHQRDETPPLKGMKRVPQGAPNCLKSFVFVVTGILESLTREEVEKMVTDLGGTFSKSLGKKVTHAIVGESAGPSKVTQLSDRQIPMINEDGFFELITKLSGGEEQQKPGISTVPSANTSSGSNIAQSSSTASNDAMDISPSTNPPSSSTMPPRKSDFMIPQQLKPVSLTVTLPSPVHPRVSTLWTDKYKPKSSSELVGNSESISKLIKWLNSWYDNYANEKTQHQVQMNDIMDDSEEIGGTKAKGTGKSKPTFPRAALLVGPPGVGKTCSALIVSEECGFIPVEMNASDQRSKSTLQEKVASLLNNRGINEFYQSPQKTLHQMQSNLSSSSTSQAKRHNRTILIMDEIDGMSSGDRGGLQELNLMIKSTKIPIIAVANDRYKVKTLATSSNVLCLPFGKPSTAQIFARIASIASNEKLALGSDDILRRLIDSCQGDLRMTLNMLQFLKADPGKLSNTQSLYQGNNHKSAIEHHIESSSKDITLGAFDVIPKLFAPCISSGTPASTSAFAIQSKSNAVKAGYATVSINDRLDYFFVDYSLVPLFIQQNYLKTKIRPGAHKNPHAQQQHLSIEQQKQALRDIRAISKAADSISEGDIIGQSIFSQQNFALLPAHGCISSLRPCAILNSNISYVEFPLVLGKGSSTRKRFGLLGDLANEMHRATSGANARSVVLDYMPLLTHHLTNPMVSKANEGIQDVISFMDHYNISKEGRESVIEISELKYDKTQKDASIASKISKSTKTSFTANYKQGNHKIVTKRKKAAKASGVAGEDGAEDEEGELQGMGEEEGYIVEEEEDTNPENDSLISIGKSKKSAAKSAASSSKGAKSSSAKRTSSKK